MTAPSPAPGLPDPGAQIRLAGRRTAYWAAAAACLATALLVVETDRLYWAAVNVWVRLGGPRPNIFWPALPDRVIWIGNGLALLAVVSAAAATAALYRAERRCRFRRQLLSLPRSEAQQVLLPLRAGASRQTGKIIAPLLRELGISAEMTPTGAPEGCGDEAAAPPR